MWELVHKEDWALKNWCFQTVVLEKILETPLDCTEIKPVNPKGNQSWISIERTDADSEAEAPILWPPEGKCWLWKRSWCWEGVMAGAEGDDGGLNSWMASPTQWTWVWASSGRQWRTGKPGVLPFMGSPSQTRFSDWTTNNCPTILC